MRIGLPGSGQTVDRIIGQAERAEADGFTSLWYSSGARPATRWSLIVACGASHLDDRARAPRCCRPTRATRRSRPPGPRPWWRPSARRAGSRSASVPSHRPVVEGMQGMSYDTPGRHTDEYVQIVAALLRGEPVRFAGEEFRRRTRRRRHSSTEPRCRCSWPRSRPGCCAWRASSAAGTITWMANATSIERFVAPRIRKAAADAGRPEPRIVAGLPVAVHDDVAEAKAVAAEAFAMYGTLPNYQRILAHGDAAGPADAAIVGNEASVTGQIEALFAAGATDVWAAPFPVGDDRSASTAAPEAC